MLKQLVSEYLVTVHFVPEGPILVKSGIASLTGPDMGFVRVWRNGSPEVYLPGSSIKGVLRSHAERIARSLVPEGVVIACDPFQSARKAARRKGNELVASCGSCLEELVRSEVPEEYRLPDPDDQANEVNRRAYRDSCPICRLFGSTMFAGRLATADAYAVGVAPSPQTRDGVGIDRFTGGASPRAKFDLEVVAEGRFETTLHLRNFELWQLGLVGVLLLDLQDGLVRIGAGKSRGLGKVRGEVTRVDLHYVGRYRPIVSSRKLSVAGIGELLDASVAEAYGMQRRDVVQIDVPADLTVRVGAVRTSWSWPGSSFPWPAFAQVWVEHAEGYADRYQSMAAMKYVRGASS